MAILICRRNSEGVSVAHTEGCISAGSRGRTAPRVLNQQPEAITWARERAGLTKRALAGKVGLSEQLVGEFESGWRSATPANLGKIAEVLNCPLIILERKRPRGDNETVVYV